MGLLDIAQSMLGNSGTPEAGSGNLLGTVMQAINSQPGGLGGIVQSLQQGGFAEIVSTWIGTGANAPVSSDQLQGVLGSGVVQELAAKLGVTPETASSHLAQFLPGIVDHLTPGGEVPAGGISGAGLDLVKGLLAQKFGV